MTCYQRSNNTVYRVCHLVILFVICFFFPVFHLISSCLKPIPFKLDVNTCKILQPLYKIRQLLGKKLLSDIYFVGPVQDNKSVSLVVKLQIRNICLVRTCTCMQVLVTVHPPRLIWVYTLFIYIIYAILFFEFKREIYERKLCSWMIQGKRETIFHFLVQTL